MDALSSGAAATAATAATAIASDTMVVARPRRNVVAVNYALFGEDDTELGQGRYSAVIKSKDTDKKGSKTSGHKAP